MADIFSNDRIDGSPEEEISGKNKNDEIDISHLKAPNIEELGSSAAAAAIVPQPPNHIPNEQSVASEKKVVESQRVTSIKVSGEVFEKSISSSELVSEHELQKKNSKFVANSSRHA
uniref:Uncharacterized protein n=1 Tax=Panagrolaimus sp. PS1159 TaxID=55785 RepID=A0AC35FEN1_9BILA